MTPITITRPGKYTNGDPCYITENLLYPGIVGYGKEPDDARASFEAARRAYDELTQSARPVVAMVSMTMFLPATVIHGMPPRAALAGA